MIGNLCQELYMLERQERGNIVQITQFSPFGSTNSIVTDLLKDKCCSTEMFVKTPVPKWLEIDRLLPPLIRPQSINLFKNCRTGSECRAM